MFQTIVIYVLLFFLLYFLFSKAQRTGKWRFVVLAIIIYSIVFGIRKGVGADYYSYLDYYDGLLHGIIQENGFEIGFSTFSRLCSTCHFNACIYFGIIAFIQLYFTVLAIKRYPLLYKYFIVVFFLGCYWLSYSNGLRQIIAFSLFVFALKYIETKEWLKYYLIILLAITFHTSAVVLLLVYPFFYIKKDWFRHPWIQFCVYLSAIVLGVTPYLTNFLNDNNYLFGYLSGSSLSKYLVYKNKIINDYTQIRGIGWYIIFIQNSLMVLYSKKIKTYFNSDFLKILYSLFFISLIYGSLVVNSQILSRINYYFSLTSILVMSFSLKYFEKNNKVMLYILIALLLLTFTAVIYRADTNTAMYHFFWENIV